MTGGTVGGGPVRILITGGGTGGHVYPGLAVAEALAELAPQADIRFAGTRRGLESVLVPRAGHRLHLVPASGLRGMGALARLMFLVNFAAGLARSLALLVSWRPAVVLGTGGYVSGPVMTAARLLAVPCALQEQNSVPGSANRLVGRWARRIYLGFGSAARFFRAGRCAATGNPVRAAFRSAVAAGDGPEAPGAGARRVLVFGGSGGAHTLNAAASDAAAAWAARADLDLLVQTGVRDADSVRAAFDAAGAGERVRVVPYIEDMATALREADLVVCRAGAMTLAELQCVGRPAVLVPFPHATDDHQVQNARDCEEAGAAVVLLDAECDGAALTRLVDELLTDPDRLRAMAAAARGLGRPAAAQDIAADLLELAGHPAGRRLQDGD